MPTPTNEIKPTETEAAAALGMRLGSMEVHSVNDVPIVMAPHDMTLHELHHLMPRPNRIKTNVDVTTADSFLIYYNKFYNTNSTIFCDAKEGVFKGVLDYHDGRDSAGWMEHEVCYRCAPTEEWVAWSENSGAKMGQIDFAYFIEQNLDEIIRPEAAQMLEIALTLRAKTKLQFESGHRLSDGQVQFRYHEMLDGSAGIKGDIKIPETFGLGLRVFDGGAAYEMDARFRYRIADGKVLMWYDLVRPHKVHRAAVQDVFDHIEQRRLGGMMLHASL